MSYFINYISTNLNIRLKNYIQFLILGKAFEFSENRIRVTIPFNRINVVDYHPTNKSG